MKTTRPLFKVLGSIQDRDGRHAFVPSSPAHMRDQLSRLKLGTKVSVSFEEQTYTRSDAQLAYYWVLIGYLSDYCGYTPSEMHDAICRLRFGTKTVTIGNRTVEVRRSISDAAKMPTADMGELINFALELCAENDVNIPSAESLGYISNH